MVDGGGDGGGGFEGSEEEGEVEGEGDAIIVLARYAVIGEEGFLFELGDGLDTIVVEEVVEEKDVVFGEIDMADLAHLLKGWDEATF